MNSTQAKTNSTVARHLCNSVVNGLTKREHIASCIAQGLAHTDEYQRNSLHDNAAALAQYAVECADALIEALNFPPASATTDPALDSGDWSPFGDE